MIYPVEGTRVLFVADTHCPCMHPSLLTLIKKVKKKLKPDLYIHVGDVVDWNSIKYHPKVESSLSLYDEIDAARAQVSELHKVLPNAYVMIGNHDALPTRLAADVNIPTEGDYSLVKDIKDYWPAPSWTWVPRFGKLMINPGGDTCVVMHGDGGVKNLQAGAVVNAFANGCVNFIQGHLHTKVGMYHVNNGIRTFWGINSPCGLDIDTPGMQYQKRSQLDPVVGVVSWVVGESPHINLVSDL